MDTKTLVAEAKARFAHNLAKDYLKEKYEAKLLVAEQGGLWKADLETISFLQSWPYSYVVLVDTFGNPMKVDSKELKNKLQEVYQSVMKDWHTEWMSLENKR